MKKVTGIIILLGVFLVSGCEEESPYHYETDYSPPAESRSFYMGMTPHPHDYTQEGVDEAYKILSNHTDIIAHHFDDGIPWPEAYEGRSYHPNVENELSNRVKRLRKDQKVYVALAPLAHDRYSLAGYWEEASALERPGEWKHKKFDDPQVVTAYINFCRDLINRFDPDYFNYGVEVNGNWKGVTDPNFVEFLGFAEKVYTTLKKEYPDLPIFVSFIKNSPTLSRTQVNINRKLLQFSDYVAVSTYPFVTSEYAPDRADPSELPRDWFSLIAELAPEKPFCIAETGYIAEDLIIDAYNIHIEGKAEYQAEYVKFLLEEMNNLNAEFVIWFVPRDYDLAWERLEDMGFPPWGRMWRDCGFIDENGNPRPALGVWDSWLGLPKKEVSA